MGVIFKVWFKFVVCRKGRIPMMALKFVNEDDLVPVPDYKIQKEIMQPLLSQRLAKGDEWYLVDCKWLKQWKKYTGYDNWDQTSAGKENANPGPIDNADLFKNQTSDKLKGHLMEELDYSLLPKPAYDILVGWYGLSMSSRHICRRVAEFGTYVKYLKVGVYLFDLKLCIHPKINETKSFLFSRADTVKKVQNKIIEIFEVPSGSETRLWQRYMSDTYEVLSNVDQTLSDAGTYEGQLIMLEVKNKDGKWPRGDCSQTYKFMWPVPSYTSSLYKSAVDEPYLPRSEGSHSRQKLSHRQHYTPQSSTSTAKLNEKIEHIQSTEPVCKPLKDRRVVFESAIIRRSNLIGNLFKKFKTEFLALEEDGAMLRSFKDDKKRSTNLNYSLTSCTSVVIRSDAHNDAGWPADIAVERCFVLNNTKNFLTYFIAETPELAKEWIEKLEEAREKHYVEPPVMSPMTPVHDYEYLEQKKKDDETQHEQKLAKEYGLTVEEYRVQKEIIDRANKERDDKNDQKANQQPFIPPDPPIEEEGTAGTGHGGVEDSVALVTSGQPVSDERMEEERKALERFNSQVDNQPPHPLYHEYEKIPSLIQQRVIEVSAGNGASTTSSQGNHPDYQNISVNEIQAIKHGLSPNMSNRENYSSLPSILNDRQPSVPVSSSPLNKEDQFAIGSMVVIRTQGAIDPLKGVVKWIGTLPEVPGLIAGVELDTKYPNCTDGTWKGRRFFKCPNGRGYFSPLRSLQQDVTFIDKGQVAGPVRQSIENPLKNKSVLFDENDGMIQADQFSKYIGFEHGIQGHYNSCYLDSTVFGLFALSEIFDEMFLQEPNDESGRKIRDILWKGIINPLRNRGLALHESVMNLHDSLEELGQMKGANRDEKDPEEFLNLLFKEILHVEPFLSIKRPFGIEKEFFIQLFLQVDPNDPHIPETEKLLHQFFHGSNISFTKPPSKLLLQMPRFGKDFKMCDKIIPSLQLNVRPLVDRENGSNMGYDDSVVYTMNLLSVICIETSHYVCFTRDKNNKWLFHDSMADRVYDMYNIPRVEDVTDCLNEWVYSPENHERLMKAPSKNIPEYVRHFTQDIYMCVYVNEYLAMHGADDPESTLSPTTTTVTQPPLYDSGMSFIDSYDYLFEQNPELYIQLETLEMESEATRLRNEQEIIKQKEELEKERERLVREKKQLETKLTNKERELTNLARNFESENKILKEEKASLERKNATLEREKLNLEGEKKLLDKDKATQLMEMQAMQQDTQELQGRIARLSIENMKLQGELKKNESWKISRKDVKMTRQELGRGGWGVIWVGQFRGQKVAVKQMHKSIMSEYYLELLHREINTMSQLRHPNLVQFIGAVLDDPSGQPLIITEIMDMSLREAYMKKQLTPVPVNICLAVMRDVAVGLNYLHCLPDPIIHRDVSSANVLLESKGHRRWKTKISDFGSAKFARAAVTKATGAAAYSAPEAFQSASILDDEEVHLLTPKMDVFSYGVLLCEVLTCQFPDQQEFKAMLALVRSQHNPYLHDLIQSCIKRNPQDRPNMDQVIQQLDSPHT